MAALSESLRSVSVIGADVVFDRSASVVRRFVWLLLILSGAGVAAFLVWERISTFMDRNYAVNIWIDHPQDFPSSDGAAFVGKILVAFMAQDCYKRDDDAFAKSCLTSLERNYNVSDAPSLKSAKFFSQLMQVIGKRTVQVDSEVLGRPHCMFRRKPCDPSYLSVVESIMGGCAHFDGQPHVISQAGMTNSLQLTLTLEPHDWVARPEHNLFDGDFQVFVHTPAVVSVSDPMVPVRAGQDVTIIVRRSRTIELPEATGCTAVRQNKYVTELPYSRATCMVECYKDFAQERCGCVLLTTVMGPRHVMCGTVYSSACFMGSQEVFNKKYHAECDCPEACDRVS